MALVSVQTRPGIVKERTQFANSGGWFDGDKVRFRAGYPESIGGWKRLSTFQVDGIGRSLHEWSDLSGSGHLAVGTNSKYYIISNNSLYDVTPKLPDVDLGNDPFIGNLGTNKITVSMTSHDLSLGDFVTFSGASGTIGSPNNATLMNREFSVYEVLDVDSFIVIAPVGYSFSDPANIVAGGGSSVVAHPNIPTGLISASYARGYGLGPFGSGAWGRPTTGGYQLLSAIIRQPALWSQDNFGEDLIVNPRGGPIYIWDASESVLHPENRLSLLSAAGGAADVPGLANEVFVSTANQSVVALGCCPYLSDELDPMYVRWSDQLNPYVWTPLNTNSAGGYRLPTGSAIIGRLSVGKDTLIWTDRALYLMKYAGGNVIYGFPGIGTGVGIISPRGAVSNGLAGYWMDQGAFYSYNGAIQELPCDLKDYVFKDINLLQGWKVCTFHNQAYSEITWFYPSKSSDEIDRYVTLNYKDVNWTKGTMDRTSWLYSSRLKVPIAIGTDGKIYLHETGSDADTEPMESYIECSDFDSASGNEYLLMTRFIPDIEFTGTGKYQAVSFDFLSRDTSGDQKRILATIPVNVETKVEGLRIRGRRLSFRLGSNSLGTGWRLGKVQFDMAKSGSR